MEGDAEMGIKVQALRTLCWSKLAEDYRFKSLLFLAFTRRLFIQISEAIFPNSHQVHTHTHTHTCAQMK